MALPLSDTSLLPRLDQRYQVHGTRPRDIAVRFGLCVAAGPHGLLDDHDRVRLEALETLSGRDQHALPLVPASQFLGQWNRAEPGRQLHAAGGGD